MEVSLGRVLRVVFSLFFLVLFCWMIWEAYFGYGAVTPGAANFPKAILLPAIALASIAVLREALRKQPEGPPPEIAAAPVDFEFEEEAHLEPAVEIRRTVIIIMWILGFFVGIWLIGWMVTVPLAIFLYTKVGGGEGWRIPIIAGIGGWILFDGLFDSRLHIPLSENLDGILLKRFEEAAFSVSEPLGDAAALITEKIQWLFLQIPILVVLGIALVSFLAYNLNDAAKGAMDRAALQLRGLVKRAR